MPRMKFTARETERRRHVNSILVSFSERGGLKIELASEQAVSQLI